VIDDVTTYTNGKSAEIYGLELNFVRQFPRLPGALGGLGIYANATFQHSKADTGIEGVARTISSMRRASSSRLPDLPEIRYRGDAGL
jgi:predicted N-formylglutamate amidohydrolase